MKVTVTQKHIDEGIPCRASSCPIALALKEQGYSEVFVGTDHVSFYDGLYGGRSNLLLPEKAEAFVKKVDARKGTVRYWLNKLFPPKPFTFELNV